MQILSCALDVGEQILINGGEIYRVEDCIRRICMAYGAEKVDVFTITSSIVATVRMPNQLTFTQTRRIESYTTNLYLVDQLNQLSRQMCREKPDYETFQELFRQVLTNPTYPQWVIALFYAICAGAFTLFFGGGWREAAVSTVIGLCLRGSVLLAEAVKFNRVLSNLLASFTLSILAFLSIRLGLAGNVDQIVIGNIMLLIPGAALTNSLRDMITGDTMAGLLRFCEACILALAIAAGYILAAFCLGGGSL